MRCLAAIVAALSVAAMTADELAPIVFITPRVARRYLRHLHVHNAIRVAAWRAIVSGNHVAQWIIGPGPDARRPKAKTAAQRQLACSKRRKLDPEVHAVRRDLINARRRADKAALVPASWMTALMIKAPAASHASGGNHGR
jgi:hypothetical protein